MESRSLAYEVELSLPEDGGSTARARDFTREILAGSAYQGRHDDVVLVVSELVSNALRHGHGAPVLRLLGTAGRIRVEVADDSPVPPRPRDPGPDGGLGLRLVERLAVRWGCTPYDPRQPEAAGTPGKVVWCELAP
ncbi:ATP-binding protein [Streptomyces sp. B1866]|uniref:ATP-binding protein n=1 Tax=Streptomyces sp. B1866 TaxID=3075431 RepID=UPI0028913AD2|nr:ATP-binding protein [Streptomyces sp. B1866]MDT3397386.1 ATP-binding protein [Streptomyces sp. B1866]